jgi:hypothetical protein
MKKSVGICELRLSLVARLDKPFSAFDGHLRTAEMHRLNEVTGHAVSGP